MSAPEPPPDNSMQIRQMEIDEARRREEEEARKKEQHRQELAALRSSSRGGATGAVRNYFSSQGVDPDQYGSDIEGGLDDILRGIAPEDENPGSYFQNAGQSIYENLQTGRRTRMNNALDTLFGQNYDTRRIPFTLDDPYLSSIEEEQYHSADDIIRNMMDRGVLTGTGSQAARQDLERQRSGVKSRLNEIGTGVLSEGQQKLRDIANNARETAGTLRLGQTYDPYSYTREADTIFDDFIKNLGTNIRGRITGPLFTTAGLAAIGGAGQGAQNGAYNPNAAAGIFDDEDQSRTTTNTNNQNSIF